MTQKFGRNYRLTIFPLDGGEPIIITMPFTIRFSLTRDINSSANPLVIEIFNLSEANRQRIFQDWFAQGAYLDGGGQPIKDGEGLERFSHNIILEIGYDTLYRVYYGGITKASSAREGSNIVTRIEAMDNILDVAGTQTFQTLDAGVTLKEVFQSLIGQFPTLETGAIGDYPQVFNRPVTLNGNTWNILKQYSAGQVYIDSGRVYILQDKEVLNGIHIVNDASGILETPRRQQAGLEVITLMEAGVNVGEMLKLESSIMKEYDGTYKVLGITHSGTISAAVCEECTTRFFLQAPNRFYGFTVVDPYQAAPGATIQQ